MSNLLENKKKIENAILASLSFFAIFSYALNADELYRYLYFNDDFKAEIDLLDFRNLLDELVKKEIIKKEDNLYYLFDTNKSVLDIRRKYYLNYRRKLDLSIFYTKWMSKVPGIKAIALVNSVAMGQAKLNSDLDFFIITDKKALWLSRFILTSILKIFNLRPNSDKMQDTICTSFWIREDALDLSKIKYQDEDIYLYYWMDNVYFLYDSENFIEKFAFTNQWVKKKLKNSLLQHAVISFKVKKWQEKIKNLFVSNYLNSLSKKIQYYLFSEKIKEKILENNTDVLVNGYMLKMHTVDNRARFYNIFKENLNKIKSKA